MFSRFAQSFVNAFAQCACAASSCAENKTVLSMDAALSASIFLSILLLNLRMIQFAFLRFLDWFLGFLLPCKMLMVIQ